MGLLNVTRRGSGTSCRDAWQAAAPRRFRHARHGRAAQRADRGGREIEVQYVHGHWRGVNDLDELRRAGDFAHGQAPYGSSGAASTEAGA